MDGLSAVQFDPSQMRVFGLQTQQSARPHPAMDAAANLLGMSASDLRTALQSGQSLSDVAASKGVGKDDLIKAMAGAIQQAHPNVSADEATQIATTMATRTRPADAAQPGGASGQVPSSTDASGTSAAASTGAATGHHHHHRHHAMSTAVDAASQLLGMSTSDLTSALKSGQSLSAIASSKGVSSDSLVSAIATALQGADGNLSVDDAKALATNLVNRTPGSENGSQWSAGSPAAASTGSTFEVLA